MLSSLARALQNIEQEYRNYHTVQTSKHPPCVIRGTDTEGVVIAH